MLEGWKDAIGSLRHVPQGLENWSMFWGGALRSSQPTVHMHFDYPSINHILHIWGGHCLWMPDQPVLDLSLRKLTIIRISLDGIDQKKKMPLAFINSIPQCFKDNTENQRELSYNAFFCLFLTNNVKNYLGKNLMKRRSS